LRLENQISPAEVASSAIRGLFLVRIVFRSNSGWPHGIQHTSDPEMLAKYKQVMTVLLLALVE
jgi:hypothetical protein